MTEEHITQVSEEIECRVTKKRPGNLAELTRIFRVLCPNLTIFSEPASTEMLWNRSGNLPEQWLRKLGTQWGSFPEWSLSQSGVLCSSGQHISWLRPGRDLSQISRGLLRETFSSGGSKLISECLEEQFAGKCFWTKFCKVFRTLGELSELRSQKNTTEFSKLHSTCSEKQP